MPLVPTGRQTVHGFAKTGHKLCAGGQLWLSGVRCPMTEGSAVQVPLSSKAVVVSFGKTLHPRRSKCGGQLSGMAAALIGV